MWVTVIWPMQARTAIWPMISGNRPVILTEPRPAAVTTDPAPIVSMLLDMGLPRVDRLGPPPPPARGYWAALVIDAATPGIVITDHGGDTFVESDRFDYPVPWRDLVENTGHAYLYALAGWLHGVETAYLRELTQAALTGRLAAGRIPVRFTSH